MKSWSTQLCDEFFSVRFSLRERGRETEKYFWQSCTVFMSVVWKSFIIVGCRRIPLDSVPTDTDEACAEWLHAHFREKVTALVFSICSWFFIELTTSVFVLVPMQTRRLGSSYWAWFSPKWPICLKFFKCSNCLHLCHICQIVNSFWVWPLNNHVHHTLKPRRSFLIKMEDVASCNSQCVVYFWVYRYSVSGLGIVL